MCHKVLRFRVRLACVSVCACVCVSFRGTATEAGILCLTPPVHCSAWILFLSIRPNSVQPKWPAVLFQKVLTLVVCMAIFQEGFFALDTCSSLHFLQLILLASSPRPHHSYLSIFGQRWGRPWTSSQLITELTYRDKQPSTLTFTPKEKILMGLWRGVFREKVELPLLKALEWLFRHPHGKFQDLCISTFFISHV